MLKKLLSIFLLINLCLGVSACDEPYGVSGIENYHPAYSEFSTSDKIMPDDFLNKFEYVSGDYRYMEENFISWTEPTVDRSLVWLSYDSFVYADAKQYAMDNMVLSESAVEEYNGYVFYDNYADIERDGFSYPRRFKRFGYNDSKNTLIFIGFYHSDRSLSFSEWSAFLEEFYNEWYDFSV